MNEQPYMVVYFRNDARRRFITRRFATLHEASRAALRYAERWPDRRVRVLGPASKLIEVFDGKEVKQR